MSSSTDDPSTVLRNRLYAAYRSTHAGQVNPASEARLFLRDIAPHLPSDRQTPILDVGCGHGQLVDQLAQAGFSKAGGVDISAEQVQAAHAAGIHQVRLADYRDSLRRAEYGAVVATDFLEHLTKEEVLEAFDLIRSALLPQGVFIVRVPNAVSPFGGHYQQGDFTHETSFTPWSLRQVAAAAGFSSVELFACAPRVHGAKSAVRALLWRAVSATMKAALVVETGYIRGHVVTQNMVAVMHAAE